MEHEHDNWVSVTTRDGITHLLLEGKDFEIDYENGTITIYQFEEVTA